MGKVVILAGGFGTRIRDVADNIPKPMIPIGNYPILWHIMKYYSQWGHKEFVILLGYKGQVIKDFFVNYNSHTRDFTLKMGKEPYTQYHTGHGEEDWEVTLTDTGLNSMTGARLKRAKKYLENDDYFMFTYGDGVGDIKIDDLIQYHKSHGKILTVTGVRPPGRFGELVCNETGLVTEFNEKPQATGGLISGGYFVCNREIFNYLTDDEDLVFEEGPMKKLAAVGQMMVYQHDGFWQPMDTYREYSMLNKLYNTQQAPWVIWK